MIQRANIKMPLACWMAIKGTKDEYSVLDDGTIEHLIMYPSGFFANGSNQLEWIAARVRVPNTAITLILCGSESMACNFAEFYDTNLLEITFEV
jgi:hypothetical protein